MARREIRRRGTNALRGRPIEVRISGICRAPTKAVFDLLADLQSHLVRGGARGSKRPRLLTMQAPAGPAAVGTEFTSTGEDWMVRANDRSVVTEAVPFRTFEFVTESSWHLKRSGRRVDWTFVHHYDIAPGPVGSRIAFSVRATRATSLPGPLAMLRVPVLRSVVSRMWMRRLKGGMRNFIRMAEESHRANTRKGGSTRIDTVQSSMGSIDRRS